MCVGMDGSVGVAIPYGLDGLGISKPPGQTLRNHPDRPWGPTSLLYDGYRGSFSGREAAGGWR